MKFLGFWLCAASALALAGCGQHKPAATRLKVETKVAAAQPAAVAAGSQTPAPGPHDATPSSHAAAPSLPGRKAVHAASGGRAATGLHAAAWRGRTGRVPAKTRHHAHSGSSVEADARVARAEAYRWNGPQRYSAEYEACISTDKGFTVSKANCYSAELARQGARVDRAYSAALAVRSAGGRQRLSEAQRVWVRERDAQCRDEPPVAPDDLLHEGSCRLDVTVQRAIELEKTAS
jgi:uncharacterized protein YecT (DUF1311 family)